MKTIFIFFNVLACLMAASTKLPVKMNNIDYLAKGYNIFKGNPLSEKDDPGFTLPIFKFTYSDKVTGDGRYEVPKGMSITQQESCDSSLKVEEMTTEANYHNKLEIYASQEWSAGFSGIGASLSFNEHYQTIKNEKNISRYTHIISSAECSKYKGNILTFNPPLLDDDFKYAFIKMLPEDYKKKENKEIYFDFLDSYGTHYVKEASMGSRMARISSMTENDKKELKFNRISIEASASASFLDIISVKYTAGLKKESSQSVEFDKRVQTHTESYIGSKPKGDFLQWANQVFENPMPIKYKLAPIYSLKHYVRGEGNFIREESEKVERVFANLEAATNDYCQERVIKRFPGQKCEAPKPEEKPATYGSQCALCAKSCGDDYPIESGTLASGVDSSNFQVLPQGCFGEFGHHDLGKDGVKLCCMPQSKEKAESCRFCETCGGGFSSSRGKVAKGLQKDNWVKSYGTTCDGNLVSRLQSPKGFEFCCVKSSPCKLCTSCGNDHYETGMFGIGEANKDKYEAFGDQCKESLKGGRTYRDGLKLCCEKPSAINQAKAFLRALSH